MPLTLEIAGGGIPLSGNNFHGTADVSSWGKKLPAKKLEKTAVPGQLCS